MLGFALVSLLAAAFTGAGSAPATSSPPPVVSPAPEKAALPPPHGDDALEENASTPLGAAAETSAATPVFADESDQEVADRLLSAVDAISTLSGDFSQVAPSGALSTGKFYLRRPGLLRFQYDEPSPLLIVANGGLVYVRDNKLETTDSYPVGKTPLKFLLKKKVDMSDAKVVAVDREADSVAVTFASSDPETEGDLTVVMGAPALKLRQWVVRDPQNGVTIVTLNNVVEGTPLANRLFAVPEAESPFLKN
ncbi:MAG TPA: outer membrane lipoprotein carrier protein LolA [Parvularculaceae bacterium]|nr:outer membrane lipoprotein carrier protein LolA [Parvularculaceae bacterium]